MSAQKWPLRWWDLATVTTILLLAIAVLIDVIPSREHQLGSAAKPVSLGILAALALLYVVVGRRDLLRATNNEPLRASSTVFLVLLIACIGAGIAVTPHFAVLQALGYPIVWTVVPGFLRAITWNVVLGFVAWGGLTLSYVQLGVEGAFQQAFIIAVLSLAFSLVMGTWITTIFTRGEEHRILAEQLREAQDAVAELSRETGAARERERLSRELHDTLTQTLTGLVMLGEQARQALDAENHRLAADRTMRIEEAARLALTEARALVATTQPLGEGGLRASIERIARRLREDTGLEVGCDLNLGVIDREIEVILLRAAQEAIANARKHARARNVWISMRQSSGALAVVTLTVDDDGVGLPEDAPQRGFGLSGMQERVRLVGGDIEVGSSPHGGTRFQVELPARIAAQTSGEHA